MTSSPTPLCSTITLLSSGGVDADERASLGPATEKKPRQGTLTRGQKRHNRKLSRVRVRVEHALAGVKCSRIVKDVLRNTNDDLSDLVMVVACGLHNLRVRYRKRRLRI